MKINTLEDWNAVAACCCPMPGCPAPVKTAFVVSATVRSVGFFEVDEDDEYVSPWVIYAERTTSEIWEQDLTVEYFTFMWEGSPRTEISWQGSASGTMTCTSTYNRVVEGEGWMGVDQGGTCDAPLPPATLSGTGTNSFSGSEDFYQYHIDGVWLNGYYQVGTSVTVGVYLGGVEFPAGSGTIQPLCTQGFETDYTYVSNPLPSLPSSSSSGATPPSIRNGHWEPPVISLATPANYEEWCQLARDEITAALESVIYGHAWVDCPGIVSMEPDDFEESESVTPEPTAGGVNISMTVERRVGYGFCLPTEWHSASPPKKVWRQQWDVAAFHVDWDAWDAGGRIGPEPFPRPVRLRQESWEWDAPEGPLCSPRYTWPLPPSPRSEWTVRVVNLGVICYESTRTGVLPTFHGEQYPFPDE